MPMFIHRSKSKPEVEFCYVTKNMDSDISLEFGLHSVSVPSSNLNPATPLLPFYREIIWVRRRGSSVSKQAWKWNIYLAHYAMHLIMRYAERRITNITRTQRTAASGQRPAAVTSVHSSARYTGAVPANER